MWATLTARKSKEVAKSCPTTMGTFFSLNSVPPVRANFKHILSGQGIKVVLNIYQLVRIVKRVAKSQVEYIFSIWQIKEKYVPAQH
jgi:hypothetical protein